MCCRPKLGTTSVTRIFDGPASQVSHRSFIRNPPKLLTGFSNARIGDLVDLVTCPRASGHTILTPMLTPSQIAAAFFR
jgi:hypothetical protein